MKQSKLNLFFQVWDVVVGTKSSVDVLVPKSEALISTSNRQERAINSIQTDLTEKANKIIQNIAQVMSDFTLLSIYI